MEITGIVFFNDSKKCQTQPERSGDKTHPKEIKYHGKMAKQIQFAKLLLSSNSVPQIGATDLRKKYTAASP